jgi:predicted kinase
MTDRDLVVLAGKPGTGKTTLARLLATNLPAVYVRVDAIETAVVDCGLAEPPVGVVGYVVAHLIARANLALGSSVVVDAVNPVPEARNAWRDLAAETGSTLSVFETVLHDPIEHRSRVTARQPDMPGQRVPSWDEVAATPYLVWDEVRDGPRIEIDMLSSEPALARALAHLGRLNLREDV